MNRMRLLHNTHEFRISLLDIREQLNKKEIYLWKVINIWFSKNPTGTTDNRYFTALEV